MRERGAESRNVTRRRVAARWLGAFVVLCTITLLLTGSDSTAQSAGAEPPLRVPSNVAWTEETLSMLASGDALHGLVLARRCNHCHGEEGFSAVAAFPNLAGQDRLSFWKQMQDFRSGKRKSPVMQGIAEQLSPHDAADLAAYYAMLPTGSDPQDTRAFPQPMQDATAATTAIHLIVFGDGQRGIPPCQSCHGPISYVKGAPPLATQNGDYLHEQLEHFTNGARTNDINERMRSIAKQLTTEEKTALAQYYGAGLGPGTNGR
jgi:cytochrome c553